jgi:hypothetical protein
MSSFATLLADIEERDQDAPEECEVCLDPYAGPVCLDCLEKWVRSPERLAYQLSENATQMGFVIGLFKARVQEGT